MTFINDINDIPQNKEEIKITSEWYLVKRKSKHRLKIIVD